MNLMRLSCEQLIEFRAQIDRIIQAATVLQRAGMSPEISLRSSGTVIRAPSIIAEFVEGEEIKIETQPFDIEPNEHYRAVVKDGVEQSFQVLKRARIPERTSEGFDLCIGTEKPTAPAKPAFTASADGLVRGTWTDAQEQLLIDMHATGSTFVEIAAALSRPVPAVEFRARKVLKLRRHAPLRPTGRTAAKKPGGPEAAKTAPGKTGPSGPAPSDAAGGAMSPGPKAAPVPAQAAAPVAAPPPARVTEIAASPDAPRKAPDFAELAGDLAGEARILFRYLCDLPAQRGWDCEMDLDVVEMLLAGTRADQVALDLGVDIKALRTRWNDLSATIRNDKGHVRIDGQMALLSAIRHRSRLLRNSGGTVA